MNTLVIFFSLSGRTHYEAKRIAEQEKAERYEVYERPARSLLNAYLVGVSQARRHKKVNVEPIAVRPCDYDRVIIMCPVWGGAPAPVFNTILDEVDEGQSVEILLTSNSGRVRKPAALKRYVESKGIKVDRLEVIKTIDLKKRDKNRRRKMQEEAEKQS